ncbi:hypothetical protein [Furfurilactobacillus entadae]|uniref:hypothetical protein n=1 Tax=Furfurilactobacillus entadae TaxID=2922307 RepID=UPI0035EE3DBC
MKKALILSLSVLTLLVLTGCQNSANSENDSLLDHSSLKKTTVTDSNHSFTDQSSSSTTSEHDTSSTSVSLSYQQKRQINDSFLTWADGRALIGHMAVSDWYFDHGAAGSGDWYANTPDGRVQVQDNENPGASAFSIHSVGGCVFYKSKNGDTGKQDLYQGSFAGNYNAGGMDFDKPVSKYLLGDNGVVYELKTGNGTPVSTNTGFGQTSGEGTTAHEPDEQFEVSADTAAQTELKKLINQYK